MTSSLSLDDIVAIVGYLECDEQPHLQVDSIHALSTITSQGTLEQKRHIVDSGALPKLCQLLSSADTKVCHTVVLTLGDLVLGCPDRRDKAVECGIVQRLLALIHKDTPTTILRATTWTLANIVHSNIAPIQLSVLAPILQSFASVLVASSDEKVLTHTCSALRFICNSTENIDAVLKAKVLSRIVQLLKMNVNILKHYIFYGCTFLYLFSFYKYSII